MIEIVKGPIENVKPESNPFFMFFGKTAFIVKFTNKFSCLIIYEIRKIAKN
jgi:hypothetical protein